MAAAASWHPDRTRMNGMSRRSLQRSWQEGCVLDYSTGCHALGSGEARKLKRSWGVRNPNVRGLAANGKVGLEREDISTIPGKFARNCGGLRSQASARRSRVNPLSGDRWSASASRLGDCPRSGADGGISTLSQVTPDRHRPICRSSCDSPLEGDGFEPSVPVRQAKLTRSCR
jgi:hypothetical protein